MARQLPEGGQDLFGVAPNEMQREATGRGGDKGGRAGARPPLTLLQLHIKSYNLVANIAH